MVEKFIITEGTKEDLIKTCAKFVLTHYEKEQNIKKIEEPRLWKGNDEIEFYECLKSDNSKSGFVIFKCGKKTDFWSFWMLLDSQFDFLIKNLTEFYRYIDEHNKKNRKRGEY